MNDFEEYIRQGEPHKREKVYAWQAAIGLQAVDGLKTSDYLIQTARQHIEGDITIDEAIKMIDSYYQSKTVRADIEERTEEADKVSARITEILCEKTFNFSPVEYITIHRRLFDGIYKFAGKIRDFRNALVRANFNDLSNGVYATTEYIESFFRNLILGEQNELKNRNLLIGEKENIQSAEHSQTNASKCNNCTLDCTLEEMAVLKFIQEKPNATQKEIAVHIGKSERTIKTITVSLSEKGIIERKNGKRNGFWELKINDLPR